jgi:hypothetical protein
MTTDNQALAAIATARRHYLDRINELEDALRALLDDDNEATREDAERALECS